jgi:hypothetical protein
VTHTGCLAGHTPTFGLEIVLVVPLGVAMRALRRALIGCVAVTCGAAAVFVSTPAQAFPPSLIVVRVISSPRAPADAGATCPTGTKVLGGGGRITGVVGTVHLYMLKPYIEHGVHHFLASWVGKTADFGDNWTATTWAVCGSAVTGHEIVEAEYAGTNTTVATVTASCPAGKNVTGAGALTWPYGWVLDDVSPSPNLSGVMAQAMAMPSEPPPLGPPLLRAYAICADPIPGQLLVTAQAASSSDKTVNVTCPVGKYLYGAGGGMNGAGGASMLRGVGPAVDTSPGGAATAAFAEAVEGPNGNPANWSLAAYAICGY